MEAQDRSRSPSRRPSRVEQMVGRWLRRSRDLGSRSHSAGRDRSATDGKSTQSSGSDQKTYAFRFNVQIQRDPGFISHGLSLSTQTPILVQDVTAGGPADGRLVPGDQLVKINNVSADDLTPEQAAEIIRECQDTLTMTVLRTMLGPKSSFITPEKKAKLRCNPVKVRFAEEVEVNGQSQGNSLLFLPNVLKVYLENGQTKAFKFEPSTTVKDIVMTLKEKLSLSQIEHFSLVLEQQPGVTKLLLLHEEERIQQVVQKKEAHDYRCLFRVCFLPKNLQTLLEEDPTTFEYLYLQGVNDVLQERFAVEMKCNTALRLAALHIQERLASCGYSSKTNLKTITKTWGIENFVSTTLLRNMKEKDLKKAISYHMKKCQSLQDPKQKITSVDQARINYLEELCELKSFGGKSFSATLMLQDRESTVNLLVGARYGVSQVVNRKLSILTTLTDFSSITRVELVPESDRVSLVKIYVQDIKPITLLLETAAAKDMSCLIAGYCRVFIDPSLSVFPWAEDTKKHKISAEEGYVSRCGSDSDSSTDLDIINSVTSPRSRSSSESHGIKRKERVKRRKKDVKEKTEKQMEDKKDADTEKDASEKHEEIEARKSRIDGGKEVRGTDEYPSEASDSLHTDSRALTSPSCDSLDALEEDDLLSCSTHHIVPSQTTVPLQILHHYTGGQTDPNLLAPPPAHSHPLLHPNTGDVVNIDGRDPQTLTPPLSPSTSFQNPCNDDDNPMCFAELSRLADFLPSPPEASEDEDEEEELRKRRNTLLKEQLDSSLNKEKPISPSSTSPPSKSEYVFNFDQNDARCYYNLVSNITPDSARSLPQPRGSEGGPEPNSGLDQVPILQPPPGFGDSSSDEEFFDARDQLASPDHSSVASWRDICTVEMKSNFLSTLNPSDTQISGTEPEKGGHTKAGFRSGGERLSHLRKRSRKRRSFMETQYTSTVSFPEPDDECKKQHRKNLSMGYFDTQMLSADPEPSEQTQNPSLTLSSLTHSEGEPSQLETKPILSKQCSQESISQLRTLDKTGGTRKPEMEMEPDSMESKPVTDLVKPPSPNIMVVRCRVDPDGKEKEIADRTGDGKEELQEEELKSIVENGPFDSHMFLPGKVGDQMIENAKIGNGPLGASLVALEQNSYIEEYILQGVICNSKSFCPPPAPPSSPSVTLLCVSQNDCLGKAKEIEPSDSTKDCMSNVIEDAKSNSNPSQTDGSVNEDEALVVPSSTRTASEEVTDSTTSDNVFDDDEASVSLNSSLSETKYELVVATRKSIIVDTVKVESQIGHSEAGKRLYSLSSDYSCALYSVTSKLDAASIMSPKMESKVTFENITTTLDCTIPSLASPSLAKPNNLDISNNPTSPSHFLFQAWSPSIMGRLSASTLRSKIQNLPFYLSRSQEAINHAGSISPVQCPAIEYSEEKEIVVDVKDLNNVTESLDLPIESVESDESDATVTGSDLDAVSEEDKKIGGIAKVVDIPLIPIETEIDHQKQPITFEMENSSSEPVREPPTSTASHFQTSQNPQADTPGPVTTAPQSKMRFGQPGEDIPGLKTSPSSSIIQPQIVVTTQTLNGPGMTFLGEKRASIDRAIMGFCRPAQPLSDSLENIAGGRRMSQTETPLNLVPSSKSETGCTSVLASECVSMVERVPLDTCGCFSEGDTFDEELTVYEFACRTQSSQVSGEDLPIITAPPVHTFLTTSSTYSPSFPRSMLSSSASEISPLLSPLFDECLQSQTHKEMVKRLGKEQYPDPPTGFQVLRSDVDQLLSLLETTNSDQSVESQRGLHPRETCPTHFTENKRVLQIEARRLMTGCHRVVAVGQSEDEMFDSLADSFRTLVGLAGLCLWFSSCDRCERRNAQAVSGLVDVTRSFRDFCVAAERASSKRSCQDLSTKLLAKQCTALTASVFCLTQLFRTLTAL